MTQKELSYLEDAIGHEDNIIKICEQTINCLEDKKLINFMENELENHNAIRKDLMEFMEGKANE